MHHQPPNRMAPTDTRGRAPGRPPAGEQAYKPTEILELEARPSLLKCGHCGRAFRPRIKRTRADGSGLTTCPGCALTSIIPRFRPMQEDRPA